jgi:hypothetical protein
MASKKPEASLDIETTVMRVILRDPDAITLLEADEKDFKNPVPRLVIETARLLKSKRLAVTVENLAAQGGGNLETLRLESRKVTHQQQLDFPHLSRLIRLAAQQRRLLEWHREECEALMRVPLLDLGTHNFEARADYVRLTQDVSGEQSSAIGDILLEMIAGKSRILSAPIPTGIAPIDFLLRGGVRAHGIHVLGGAEKTGKTTTARNAGINVSDVGEFVYHIAADGGNRHKQACYYIAMRAAMYAVRDNIPTMVAGYADDVLSWENVAVWINNRNPKNPPQDERTPLSRMMNEILETALDDLVKKKQRDLLRVVDVEKIGFSIENLVSTLERLIYTHGTGLVIIDHVGKFGNIRKEAIYDRFAVNAQMLVEVFNVLPAVLLVLSQRNKVGLANTGAEDWDASEGESYSANLEGGSVWEKEAESIWLVRRPKGIELNLRAHKMRDNEGRHPHFKLELHPATGLIIPPGRFRTDTAAGYAAVDGY